MILVDIYVPAVGNTYDFRLDEEEKISAIIEEISELIGQKEHCKIVGDIEQLMLCSQKDRMILPGCSSLAAAGIKTGSSLLLV